MTLTTLGVQLRGLSMTVNELILQLQTIRQYGAGNAKVVLPEVENNQVRTWVTDVDSNGIVTVSLISK